MYRYSATKEILTFSAVTIALSSLICFIAWKAENPSITIMSVFTPTLTGLVLSVRYKGRTGLQELFIKQTFKKFPLRWGLVSLLGIPLLASLAILTDLKFEVSEFSLRTTQLLPQIVIIGLISIGEEYGWRGYLLPRLFKKFSVFHSGVLVGLIWGLWHFPAYLIGTGVPLDMDFLVFLGWVVLASLFISWVYYYTESVFTSILVHSSANMAFNYLHLLPEFTGTMSPFWLLLFYLTLVVAVVYYMGRKRLLKPPAA
ncbi:hypothetical protein SAMN04490243_1014 [Robiginitalea myxolifaciens]|uniref:CAAX prenyl protease 2/Lysostaphin resistance protein A-like domain-containing protein n=1 Tax=Robiginitalea myxolifaciens TaxID=400055 RepID=A0A1I6G087_9FLAO|nr:type II CAAX endopeptidase family protein [Robiginitalea myxolifaciens]SFR35589.1 hypothetical protein SAMN04490243_1014 [Robiginitalea myxolifaciens]